jgi:hypothetical protein
MSDSDCFKPGDTVIISKPPKKAEKKDNSGCQALFLIALGMLAVLYFLSKSTSSTDTFTPLALSTGESLECAPDIAIGKRVSIANVSAVRMRSSPGYVGKADADTLRFMARGEQAVVKDGPQKRDGLCWWFVEYQGLQGWAADHSSGGTVLLSAIP